MRINELIYEQQLDELGIADVGRGIGKVAGGIGATVGGVRGAWDAAKAGYQVGRGTVGGKASPDTAQQAAAASRSASTNTPTTQAGATAAPSPQVTQTIDQLKQVMPTLTKRDLLILKKSLDDAIVLKTRTPKPAATPTPVPNASNLQVQQGGGAPAAGPTTGQQVSQGGKTYQFLGRQWAEVNPQTGKPGRIAPSSIAASLNQLAGQGAAPAAAMPESKEFYSKFLSQGI